MAGAKSVQNPHAEEYKERIRPPKNGFTRLRKAVHVSSLTCIRITTVLILEHPTKIIQGQITYTVLICGDERTDAT